MEIALFGSYHLAKSIALLSKQFNRVLEGFGKKSGNNSGGTSTPKKFRRPSNKKNVEKFVSSTLQKEKILRCINCEGYGHFEANFQIF